MKFLYNICLVAVMSLLLSACSGPATVSEPSGTPTTESGGSGSAPTQPATGPASSVYGPEAEDWEPPAANQGAAHSTRTTATDARGQEGAASPSRTSSSAADKKTTAPFSSTTHSSAAKPSAATRPASSPTTAATTSAAATTTTAAPAPVDRAEEITALVNAERAKEGLPALTLNRELSANATVRAGEIISNFAHTRPDGSSFSTAITISYRRAGENIAYGYPTAAAVMNGWMDSSGHRANILGASFTQIGVGVVQTRGVLYWVQLFTG